jgi:N-acetylglucosamine-6-phosphate deacetylase
VCKLADRSALAGSIATMDRLIRTCVQMAGIPLEDAIRMSSETPARIMGELGRKGTLEKGKDADICFYDQDVQLHFVMQQGKIIVG